MAMFGGLLVILSIVACMAGIFPAVITLVLGALIYMSAQPQGVEE